MFTAYKDFMDFYEFFYHKFIFFDIEGIILLSLKKLKFLGCS